MEQVGGDAWAEEVTALVAQEVKRHRERQGMSAQRLSDACSENGYPIPRTMITKLENGYRRYVTVAEVEALAEALQVPFVALLVPLDAPSVPVLPVGTRRRPAAALAWLRGDRWLGVREPATYGALRTYVKADEAARELYDLLGQWGPKRGPGDELTLQGIEAVEERLPGWRDHLDRTIARLRDYRAQLRQLGYPLPTLPLGLEWVDPRPAGIDEEAAPKDAEGDS